MSSVNVVDSEGAVLAPTSEEDPDFIILPSSYITAEWPSLGIGSTVVQVFVVRSRTRVSVAWRVTPASSTLPSGSTNMSGYRFTAHEALGNAVQVFSVGL